jgi:hypothetical protein
MRKPLLMSRRVVGPQAPTERGRSRPTDRSNRKPRHAWRLLTAALLIGVAACGTVPGPASVTPPPTGSDTQQGSLMGAAGAGPAPALVAGSSLAVTQPAPSSSGSAPDPAAAGTAAPSPTQTRTGTVGPVLPASPPVYLSVPAIGIGSPLIELGLNPDGSVEVPSLDDPDSKPGWYRNSPTPGAVGPAIILGHIDSRQFGPGVFYSLPDLQAGDTVEVTRADGTVAIFSVDDVRTVPKSDFPTLQVYGNLDHAGLRLITCGGEFDPNARSYESNVIAFASLVGSRSA